MEQPVFSWSIGLGWISTSKLRVGISSLHIFVITGPVGQLDSIHFAERVACRKASQIHMHFSSSYLFYVCQHSIGQKYHMALSQGSSFIQLYSDLPHTLCFVFVSETIWWRVCIQVNFFPLSPCSGLYWFWGYLFILSLNETWDLFFWLKKRRKRKRRRKSTYTWHQHCIPNFGNNTGGNHVPRHDSCPYRHIYLLFLQLQHWRNNINSVNPPNKHKLDLNSPRGKSTLESYSWNGREGWPWPGHLDALLRMGYIPRDSLYADITR